MTVIIASVTANGLTVVTSDGRILVGTTKVDDFCDKTFQLYNGHWRGGHADLPNFKLSPETESKTIGRHIEGIFSQKPRPATFTELVDILTTEFKELLNRSKDPVLLGNPSCRSVKILIAGPEIPAAGPYKIFTIFFYSDENNQMQHRVEDVMNETPNFLATKFLSATKMDPIILGNFLTAKNTFNPNRSVEEIQHIHYEAILKSREDTICYYRNLYFSNHPVGGKIFSQPPISNRINEEMSNCFY